MESHEIHLIKGNDIATQSIADDIKEALEEVKLYREGKTNFQDAKDLSHELYDCPKFRLF